MSQTHHTGTLGGHSIRLVFDKDLVVLNRARLEVDGVQVDSTQVVYGERELSTELDDGTEVRVRLHSGMVGELTRAQVQSPDGQWRDLTSA
jgi:hypothetical protein